VFNIGGGEILVVMFLALLVLGPERLPTAARQIGKFLAEFRRMSSGVQQDLREALGSEGLADTVSSFREVADLRGQIRNDIVGAVSGFGVGAATVVSGSAPSSASSFVTPSLPPDSRVGPLVAPPDGLFDDDRSNSTTSGTIIGAPGQFRDVLMDEQP
jgi:sec-independent protein translocase protein TatB